MLTDLFCVYTCTGIYSLTDLFCVYTCTGIYSITDLFCVYTCTGIYSLTDLFCVYNCTGIYSLTDLFCVYTCTGIYNLSTACTSVTSLPDGSFENNANGWASYSDGFSIMSDSTAFDGSHYIRVVDGGARYVFDMSS